MPFADASFDLVVCTAAFKNFSDPIGALNEIYRVLTPGGCASIYDLRKEASRDEIATDVRDMHLSAINALLTRWTFRFVLLKRVHACGAGEHGSGEPVSNLRDQAGRCRLRAATRQTMPSRNKAAPNPHRCKVLLG